ncbi:MAG: nitrous oxide reductase accessory protein NosL [Gammaproteobacteria bacterium]|nr:nitrous oxide reductase accessory protein NosL [Gammaproteobacteria bacterium]
MAIKRYWARRSFTQLSWLLLALLLSGCFGEVEGPQEPKWDRDACERCRMVLSDRPFAAQIHYLPEGKKRTQIAWFDDIGCATLWLEDKPWKDAAETKIWVADHRTREWIDARTAWYVPVDVSPMAYMLGAQLSKTADALDFAGAIRQVEQIEARNQDHSRHLIERVRQQTGQTEPVDSLPRIE